MSLKNIDLHLIRFFQRVSVPVARFGLFVIFFWFGLLKLLGVSPAGEIVQQLFERTVPFISFGAFYFLFALLECAIGLMFLVRGFERVVIPLLFLHMITTFMPLFLLPQVTWSGFLVPTLEGQYILKNLIIIAAAIVVAAHLRPLGAKQNQKSP